MTKIFYSLPAYSGDSFFKYNFETKFSDWNLSEIGEEIAQNFYDEHDGWEYEWPIRFAVYKEEDDTVPFALLEVQSESSPVFITEVVSYQKEDT